MENSDKLAQDVDVASVEVEAMPARLLWASGAMVVLLTVLSTLGQLATSFYLPSLPAIANSFAAPMNVVQLTLTTFLATFAVTQLFYGPISDRVGRRPPLLFGLVVYAVGSVMAALAPTVQWLIAARVVQATGAGAGMVLARAIIRDTTDGLQLTRLMALITVASALVPGVTPLFGGIVESLAGWRVTFWLITIVALATMAAAYLSIPETRPSSATTMRESPWQSYRAILSNRTFLRLALAVSFAFGGLFAFLTGSPAVFIDVLQVSPMEYGLYPPLAVSGFIVGGALVRKLVERIPAERLLRVGIVVLGFGAALMLIPPVAGLLHKHVINLAIAVFVTGLGILASIGIALALSQFRERAGAASSVLGFLQIGCGALGSVLVSVLQSWSSIYAFPLVMTLMVAASATTFIGLRQRAGTKTESH